MTQTIYRCLGLPDQYSGNFDLSKSGNRTFGRNAQRDIWGFFRGYEAMPSQLGLSGILPDEYVDSFGNRWVKMDVHKVSDNHQFSASSLSGKTGIRTLHGHPFIPMVTEKYPPVDENKGIFTVNQSSYYSELKKRGLVN
jgi:hypothetical protein